MNHDRAQEREKCKYILALLQGKVSYSYTSLLHSWLILTVLASGGLFDTVPQPSYSEKTFFSFTSFHYLPQLFTYLTENSETVPR